MLHVVEFPQFTELFNIFDDVLEYVEKAIHSHFIPALTGQPPPGEKC